MGIFDKLFGRKNSREMEAFDAITSVLTETSEPVRIKGNDLPPKFSKGKLPGIVKAMMCIIREGETPSDVIKYYERFVLKYPNTTIYENMDLYFHAFKKKSLPNEDSVVFDVLADKNFIEMSFYEVSGYYGKDENIRYEFLLDHENKKILTYSAY